jgi:4-amino-4-deoxy-L-arabinose transferase-like glycosyltransferase
VDKPPLLYSLTAAAFAAGGESEGTARAVPALATLAAVGATAWLGARLGGGGTGFVAGLALLTSTGFFVFGRYVRPESLFVAALAGGFALVLTGLAEGRRGRVAAGLVLFGVAALAKDPLGALAPPVAVGLALALAGRARPLGRWLPWPGVVGGLALACGWWLLAEIRTPGFVWYTVIDNHVLNVARARQFPDEDIPLSAGQFLAVGLLGASPWIVPAGAALWSLARRRAWRDPRETPWVALALWALGVFVATLLSPFRLPHYGLPAYFAIALLAARGWASSGGRRLVAVHALLFGALALACALAWAGDGARFMESVLGTADVAARKSAAAGQAAPLPSFAEFRPLLGAAAVTFAAGALAAGACAAAFGRLARGRGRFLPVFVVIATMLALLPTVSAALDLVASHRAVRDLGLELARRAGAGDVVAHEGPIENSGALEWYSGRRPVIVDGRQSVLGFGSLRSEARDLFWDATRLEEAWRSGRRVWVVAARPPERSLVARLPGARQVMVSAGRALWVNAPR